MPESLLWMGAIPSILAVMAIPLLWSWRQSQREHERTRATLTRLDQERRVEMLTELERAGKMDPLVRGAIAGGQVGVGRSVSSQLEANMLREIERHRAAGRVALPNALEKLLREGTERQTATDVEIAALRADVNRLLAERPQGYRRAG